ncbi:MAG: phosphoenolpyruvate--protein phosphotransferase [Candidatus Omnitrophica bacterium CG11_big_fil_rev_8_21_14_0_20_64_10]|nr:MAG: phosphoenolpyruvate--protein phosphotransferase [Candidatus Omnitrophica bacterium CG11_big_fil_rev_8_21_14_0_20_64_10]
MTSPASRKPKSPQPKILRLSGIPASAGVAVGPAFLMDTHHVEVVKRPLKAAQVPPEIARFEEALIQTRREILDIQKKIATDLGIEHGEIFDAHLMLLEDRSLIEEVIQRLKKEKLGVEWIFSEVLKRYVRTFSRIEDEYMRERTGDLEDVGRRILRNLTGAKRASLTDIQKQAIVVAYDLSPSDTATMHRRNISGFVTDIGGRTSHTAIMAKSLEIPAVVGLEGATRQIHSGDLVIVDGTSGTVIVHPDREMVRNYEALRKKLLDLDEALLKVKNLPAETPDGRRVTLLANIELPEEIPSVIAHGAEGIGLYRTEFFYLNREDLPTEEEQYQAYRHVAKAIQPHSVIIRTIDLGGDKFISKLKIPHEMNPFLGWRGIRFSLGQPELFKMQLRAILRASVHGKIKLMYPMISGVEELRQANRLLDQARKELTQQRKKFDPDLEIGAMIEVPSAALTVDLLADEVDFFSIGTNDLIQYSLAVDRVNEKIAYLYEPAHPGVLRLIQKVIEVAHERELWVGMCGEMAGEPALALILLGMGLDSFSTSAVQVPRIKQVIRSVPTFLAKEVVKEALKMPTGRDVEAFAKARLHQLVPELGD